MARLSTTWKLALLVVVVCIVSVDAASITVGTVAEAVTAMTTYDTIFMPPSMSCCS